MITERTATAANFERVGASILHKAQIGEMDSFIFDFDGVLGNSRKANVETTLGVIHQYGFKARFVNDSLEALCSRHSPEFILTTLVPELKGKHALIKMMIMDMTNVAISNTCMIEPTPLVGILPVLKGEYGARLAVATNRKESAMPAIERVGAGKHVDTVVTSLDAPEKPDRGMIEIAMARMGAYPRRTLFIGDNKEDLLSGRGAGVKVKLVQWSRR